ncbi:MAG TPA: hypothetical protein VM260_28020, partial [Pirellula sp.]|nr:hypothetical protein [Pirellula sp.]
MAVYTFGTKASTLALLQGRLKSARIAPLVRLTVAQWRQARTGSVELVRSVLGNGPWIVRSSCQREDGAITSNAGAFQSLLNVIPIVLEQAIDEVIGSYGNADDIDEVLI